jgi:hypothetical protein
MTDMQEQIDYLNRWCNRYGLALALEGEVGFGRECVGILRGDGYVDYDWADETFWTPDDAYHKYPCLAVLGRGEKAVAQLHEWVQRIDADGWTVETVARIPENTIDAIFHGYSTTRLARPLGTTGGAA